MNIGVLPALRPRGTRATSRRADASDRSAADTRAAPEICSICATGEARLLKGGAVDLGGIAKGWLADRLAQHLGDERAGQSLRRPLRARRRRDRRGLAGRLRRQDAPVKGHGRGDERHHETRVGRQASPHRSAHRPSQRRAISAKSRSSPRRRRTPRSTRRSRCSSDRPMRRNGLRVARRDGR